MKRASDATIQRRTATAHRKNIYWANIILALIPVVNGFYYFGAGGRVAMVAERVWPLRLLYLALGAVLLFLPLLAIALNMLVVEVFDMDPELGDMTMWSGYFLTGIVIGVLRYSPTLGQFPG